MVLFVVAAFCLLLGLIIRRGKGLMLLAGYNTMPRAERDKIDKALLARRAGNLLFGMALGFALLGLSHYWRLPWLSGIILLLLLIVPFGFAAYMTPHALRSRTTWGSAVILVVVLVGVSLLFWYGEKELGFSVEADCLQITGMYGLRVDYGDIAALTLEEDWKTIENMAALRRINGYGGFTETRKGLFRSDELGRALLFVHASAAPVIRIDRGINREPVYISLKAPERTQLLFEDLHARYTEYTAARTTA